MALSTLDTTAAFVAIDLQKIIAGLPTVHPFAEIVERNARLADAFRTRGWPVIWVNVAGAPPGRVEHRRAFNPPPDWTELVPGINRQASDFTITKHSIGAFYEAGLDRILRRAKVTQVFVTGVATSIGVEMTARTAYDIGYNVVTVTDAMTDLDPDAHHASLAKVFPRIGETATTDEVIAKLKG